MAGHPALRQVKLERSNLAHGGRWYTVELSYHTVIDLEGYAVGVKFTDSHSSMDSSKQINTDGWSLGKAIGDRVIAMTNDLESVSFLGFYLLTEQLESGRGKIGVRSKTSLYGFQAKRIHEKVAHKLPSLTQIQVDGGVGWGMGENNFISRPCFSNFLSELDKTFEMIQCY